MDASVASLADSRDGLRPAGVRPSHGAPVDFPPGIRHRTFFSSGRIDESRNGSRFVAIAYGAVRTTAVSADPHQDERPRRGAMPKSRRQGRGRRWRGPLSQHHPRHVRRLQVANLVAPQLHRAGGREGMFVQPGPLLALLDFPRRAQNSPACRNGLACQTFARWAGQRWWSRAYTPCPAEVSPAAKLIHPHPGRYRLEKVQGGAAGNSQ